jgi:hypothetical protein
MIRWCLWLMLLGACKHEYQFCCNCLCRTATCEMSNSVSGSDPIDCKTECPLLCKEAGCPGVAGYSDICGGADAGRD